MSESDQGKTILQMSSAELKIAHYDQTVQIQRQNQLVSVMNQNLQRINEAIVAAENREAMERDAANKKKAEEMKGPKPEVSSEVNPANGA